mmetsp:Transcript_11327/g.46018  ORF Transcript_11327/g.46018 Transcript_11327/m.46018 type:complete len:220 (+) Transcript_11327:785-1444(+)
MSCSCCSPTAPTRTQRASMASRRSTLHATRTSSTAPRASSSPAPTPTSASSLAHSPSTLLPRTASPASFMSSSRPVPTSTSPTRDSAHPSASPPREGTLRPPSSSRTSSIPPRPTAGIPTTPPQSAEPAILRFRSRTGSTIAASANTSSVRTARRRRSSCTDWRTWGRLRCATAASRATRVGQGVCQRSDRWQSEDSAAARASRQYHSITCYIQILYCL